MNEYKFKINWKTQNKIIPFPVSFQSLSNYAINWIQPDLNNSILQFFDDKTKKKIHDEQSYQELIEHKRNIKLIIEIKPIELLSYEYPQTSLLPNEKEVIEDIIEDDIPNTIEYFTNSKAKPKENSQNANINTISNKTNEKTKTKKKEVIKNDKKKAQQDISNLVHEKIGEIGKSLIEEIYKSIENQSRISKMSKSIIKSVHNGVKCSECGIENIIGTRYKCSFCQNYNLCETCENSTNHDINHIFYMIHIPMDDKDIPYSRFIYLLNGYDYQCSKTKLKSKKGNSFTENLVLSNIGNNLWKPHFKFKCFDESEVKGSECEINLIVNKNEQISFWINFNIQDKPKGVYHSYWQMYNEGGIPFGTITVFDIEIE